MWHANVHVKRMCSASGGFLGLLDALVERLPGNAIDHAEIFAGFVLEKEGWIGSDIFGNPVGTYDVLVCGYDYFMKSTRKAAIRALLESVLPDSAPVMRAVAGALDSCAFALVAEIPEKLRKFDFLLLLLIMKKCCK